MGKGNKRKYLGGGKGDGKKRYRSGVGYAGAVFQTSSRGMLVTHDRGKENFCRNDAFRLLNHLANLWYGVEKLQEEEEAEKEEVKKDEFVDVEAAMKAEREVMRSANKSKTRRFTQQRSGCNNLVFIQFNGLPVTPNQFVQRVVEAVAASGPDNVDRIPVGRSLLRCHPADVCCKANLDDIKKTARDYLPAAFEGLDADTKEFNVVYRCRNNGNLGMHLVRDAILEIQREVCPEWSYNCRSGDVMLLVDIVCATCSMGALSRYDRLKRFNLRELKQKPVEKEKQPQVEAADAEKEEEEEESCCEAAPLVEDAKAADEESELAECEKA